ncbi:MAG: cell division protein FtsZ [Bacteroidetes bacterium]|nr:cell division protein FtsZ [Fibrella sp.]
MFDHAYTFDLPDENLPIIKVVGVGGGGSNAVNHMFKLGVKDVDFIVCNTDRQALQNSPVPKKLQLGAHLTKGLGAGTNPEVGKQAALENPDDIRHLLGEPTQMVFITAGMGGGTGTGAAPVIAQIAREMGLLTIAVVTAPFDFEGTEKIEQAMQGIEELKLHCDTVLVILNDKMAEIYEKLPLRQAFAKADDVLANAVKSIAEIITVRGDINVDFMDVKRVLEQAGQAVMGSADAEGEERAVKAIEEALNSPLLNERDIRGAKRILLTMSSSSEHETAMYEQRTITKFIQDKIGKDAWLFKHGAIIDESLGAKLRVTVIAAGFDLPLDQKPFPSGTVTRIEPVAVEAESDPQNADELVDADYSSPGTNSEIAEKIDENEAMLWPTGLTNGVSISNGSGASTVLVDEERPEDAERIQQMIDYFGRTPANDWQLEQPTFVRHKVMLYEMPLLADYEIIRMRLTD